MKQILSTAAKILGSIGTIIMVGWGASKVYYNFMGRFDKIDQNIEYINIEQAFMADDIAGIHDTLKGMDVNIQKNVQTNKQLVWMERNRQQFTPEQMELLLDDFLKKNFPPIVYEMQKWDTWEKDWSDLMIRAGLDTIKAKLYSPPLTLYRND